MIEDAELPTDGGRWLYRLMAEGRMENLPVIHRRLKDACPSCKAPLEPIWQVCPFCETPVTRRPTIDLVEALESTLAAEPAERPRPRRRAPRKRPAE